MFCVECGKEKPIYKEGACIKCYLQTHSFSKGPKNIDLPLCAHCNSYKYKNTWTSDLFGDILRRVVKNNFHINKELRKIDINTECKGREDEKHCKITISGFLDDIEINEEHDLIVNLKRTTCDVCSKQFGGYHEAIFQIRANNRKLKKEELDNIKLTVENLVENLRARGNRSLFITDVGEKNDILDFYLSDKRSAIVIAKKTQEQYGGTIKQSSKNIGMKDSRQIYRMTYLLRLPSFRKGDFISYKNSFFHISSISGNKVHVLELSNWMKHIFDEKKLQKAKIIGGKNSVKEMILVHQTKNELQLMDPKNYKIFEVKKPINIPLKSKTVKTVKIENIYYLIPD
ncbi:MAG: hypothetical protein JSW62_01715 [Thermoplasmatales archaeon]|nr:MAG: hypothetical protein JSW62_01715 [Thermoplasmatales archaeon]